MDGDQAMTVNARSKISCQDRALAKDIRMPNKLKLRIHRVDYPLECCIEAKFRNIAWQITHKKRGPLSTRMDLVPFCLHFLCFFLFRFSTLYIRLSTFQIRLRVLRRPAQEFPRQGGLSPPGRCTLQPRDPTLCILEGRSQPESVVP